VIDLLNRFTAVGMRLSLLAMLAGCTSGNSAVEPTVRGVSPLAGKLTFAVGTVNYTLPVSMTQATGLNTVVAFRQADGLSDALVSTPTITGPAGFLVPSTATSAYGDAGTGHISGDPQTPVAESAQSSTFGQSGGAFSYGFLPDNSTNNEDSGSGAISAPYPQPFYLETVAGMDANGNSDYAVTFEGGPPAFTNVLTGKYPSGFTGYTLGFDTFADVTTPPGTYTLSVVVPTSSTTTGTTTATATLATATTLPTYTPPTIVEDGAGGGQITLTVPAGVTETVIEIVDIGGGTCQTSYGSTPMYTVVDHTAGPATVTDTLPDNDGPASALGVASPTLCPNDDYVITAVGGDYGIAEAAPGQPNTNGSIESPNFFTYGAGPQADVTVSGESAYTYGSTGTSKARSNEIKRLYAKLLSSRRHKVR
jgi:hypothetical protein